VGSIVTDPFKINNKASVKSEVDLVQLNVGHSSTSLTFSWPTQANGYVLESTPALAPTVWTPVPNPTNIVADNTWLLCPSRADRNSSACDWGHRYPNAATRNRRGRAGIASIVDGDCWNGIIAIRAGHEWKVLVDLIGGFRVFLREQMKKHFYSTGCVRKVMAAFAVIFVVAHSQAFAQKAPAVASLPNFDGAPGQGARKKDSPRRC